MFSHQPIKLDHFSWGYNDIECWSLDIAVNVDTVLYTKEGNMAIYSHNSRLHYNYVHTIMN
jgi:hypothetical protein